MAKLRLAPALTSVFLLVLLTAMSSVPAYAASSSELVTAVKNVAAQTDKLRSMMADLTQNEFQVVDASTVLASSDEAAFKAALKKNASDIADMRDTLTHTTLTGSDGVVMPLAKLLQGQNVKISQVVGIYISGTQITIFYQ